ncbi:hypothetical protein [Streptomyces sp. NPDC127119]|uniref:hypothetical protein n=1 Tax=Streptomyces sp. NPDC127119 TaxID=3345370 RepID=UPI00362A57D1
MGPHIPHIRNTRYVPHVRHCRTALVAALASTLLTPISAVSATAATPRFPAGTFDGRPWQADTTSHRFLPDDPADPDGPTCHAPHAPGLAARLSRDIHAALSSGRGTVSVVVRDDLGLVCERAGERQYDSAGIAKVLIMEGLLRRAENLGRSLTRALGLLAEARADQRWGVPAGMPRGFRAQVKNGWLPRSTHGWRVVVLTHDNPTKAYGVRTIERIAQVVHRGLGQRRGPDRSLIQETPEAPLSEESDGSAPYEPLPGRDEPEPDATP